MINNYIPIDRIIEKINRFKIPGGYWNIEELKEWTYDALEAINDKSIRVKSKLQLELTDNMAKIPSEVEAINTIYTVANNPIRLQEIFPYESLDSSSYMISNGYIYTDLTDVDLLEIDFYTIPLDESGNPLIPDNRLYISAVESFLQYMIAKRAFFQGKILGQQLQMLEQEWLYYLPAAQASQKMDLMQDPNRFSRIHNKFIH